MENERESFVFYKSFCEATEGLTDTEKLQVYQVIFDYAFSGIEPTENGLAKSIFCIAKPLLDKSLKRYDARVRNGKKGGRPPKKDDKKDSQKEDAKKPNQNLTETEQKPNQNQYYNYNDNVNYNDNYNDNDNVVVMGDKSPEETTTTTKKFKPPTIEEVKAYCSERNNNIDAQHFIDYYTANGWKVGKNKMKDWKACVRTWERNGYSDNSTKENKTDYSGLDLEGTVL